LVIKEAAEGGGLTMSWIKKPQGGTSANNTAAIEEYTHDDEEEAQSSPSNS